MASAQVDQPLPNSLHILPSTPQVKGLHTFIRNKDTPRDEFIFYSRRLIRLTIEFALSLLPFKDTIVETPQGVPYHGKRIATDKIIGVSVLVFKKTKQIKNNNLSNGILTFNSAPVRRWNKPFLKCVKMFVSVKSLFKTTTTLENQRLNFIIVNYKIKQ